MKKILSKKQLIVALLSIVLFVTSMGLILGIKSNKVSAVEQESVTTGVKFTYNTEVTGNQVPVFNFTLAQPISIKGATELAFHVDLGPETSSEVKDQLYFGVIDNYGNYYEFAGSGNVSKHDYRAANSLYELIGAPVWQVNSWTSSAWLANGKYFSFDMDNMFWRGSFNNYPISNSNVANIVGGGILSDETQIAAIAIRVAGDSNSKISFTISEMFARYEGGYKKLVDFTTFKPTVTSDTTNEGSNTNGRSQLPGYYFQAQQVLGGADWYGWLDPLTELYANHEVIGGRKSSSVAETFDGIRVLTNGVTTNVKENGSIIANLPEQVSLADVKNVIFTVDTRETYTGELVPFVIDANGNYYEIMGKTGIANSSMKIGKTFNSFESVNIAAWQGINANSWRGYFGKTLYSMQLQDFYWRVRFDNYGGNKEDLTLTTSGSLKSDATIRAIGVRVASTGYQTVDVIFGDAYVEKADGSIVKILDASKVSVNADNHFAYITTANTAWLGYIGGWGNATSLGWVTPCYVTSGGTQFVNGMDLSVYEAKGLTSTFDGINFKTTANTANDYQRLIIDGASLSTQTIAIRYYDRGGNSVVIEPTLKTGATTFAGLGGGKYYFVDANYNLVKQGTISWSVEAPAGFDGYIVIDMAGANKSGAGICFGFHQAWGGSQAKAEALVDIDLGDILVSTTQATGSSNFEELIANSEVYYSFTNDNNYDKVNNFSTSNMRFYGVNVTRLYAMVDDSADIDSVIDMISEISLNDIDGILEAEEAFNALSNDAKAQVINANVLNAKLEVADELKAFGDSFDMIDGAAVRLVAGSNGMKFAATMDKTAYETLETLLTNKGITFKMGTLIAPTDYGTLTLDATFKKLDVERKLWGEEVDGKLMMNAAITNILTDNYARDFSAIAYLSFEYEGETVVVYAGDVVSRSAKTVALEALADQTKTWTEAQLDVLNAYAGN